MCRGISCIILTVFNVALLLGGLALLIAGSLIKYNKALLKSLLNKALESAGASMPDAGNDKLDEALTAIEGMAAPVGNVIFIIGIVIICIAGVAFVGLCCHLRLALIIYAILIGAIFAAHTIIVIVYFSNKEILMKYVDKEFTKLIQKYKSISSGETESIALGILMPALECCGYNNGNDFDKDSEFTHQDTVAGQTISSLQYPLPCCKPSETGIGADQCPTKFTEDNSNYKEGCKKHITPVVDKIIKLSIIMVAIEAAVLALVIINLCCSK